MSKGLIIGFDCLGLIILFLYGIYLLSSTLEKYNQQRLTNFLNKWTDTTFKSIIVGIIVSTITQSSTATTAILIGLISSKVVSLKSGVAIIMGANIGTCFTVLLLSFDIQKFALLIIMIGGWLYLFFHKPQPKAWGLAILGLGLIFLSINLLESLLITNIDPTSFTNQIISAEKYLLMGVFSGVVISGIIQSSSTTIALAQTLANDQLISVTLGLTIMLGANIGTCFTGLIGSLATNYDTKILAISQLWLNLIGALVGVFFVKGFINLFGFIDNPSLVISLGHLVFNILSTIIGYFLINQLIKLSSNSYHLFRRSIYKN